MRVTCWVEIEDGDAGEPPVTTASCNRCKHETESYGESIDSETRCLVLMRKECPRRESNYYVCEDCPR